MALFQRDINPKVIKSLSASSLFSEKLRSDILNEVVFPAIRGGDISFYHKGGRLFNFKKEFSTNKKYASVIKSDHDYISDSDFPQNIQLIQDFTDGYTQIKENCSLYAGDEAKGVSSLYHKHSFVKQKAEIVVLDIEVTFESQSEERSNDRIDILLFNKKTKKLRFYEAKHFSNKEIWSSVGTKPKVIDQIVRYEKQIAQEADNILKQYCHYVEIMNSLFECNLQEPDDIDDKVALLVFGFDRDQFQGRIGELLLNDKSLEGKMYYFVGNISAVNIKNMWDGIKCG